MAAEGRLQGLLLDIDGVLTVSWEPLPGAVQAVAWLRRSRIPFRLLTNTTMHSRDAMADMLSDAGFDVSAEEIVSASLATAEYLRTHHPGARCFLLGQPDLGDDVRGIQFVQNNAEVVVVAGADDDFTWPKLNKALQTLRGGAPLIAMHRNMTWMTSDGLKLDAGAYLLGLEAATGVQATVIGKPSPDFFLHAIEMLGVEPERVAMVGDDVESDVLAAQRLGLVGVLVRTGRLRPEDLDAASDRPDHVIDSMAELPKLVKSLRA
jgi:HAD superfamily hydrolase (TIGR01458 family)